MAKEYRAFPFQLNDATSWNGLTRETHLYNAFGDKPQYLDEVVRNIFDVNYGMTFDSFLNQFPVKYVDEDKVFKWKLRGRDEKAIPLLATWEDAAGASALGTNYSRPGLNGTRFYMDFPEDYFSVTAVIVGHKPDLYHLRVMSDGVQISGNRYRYEVQLVTGDDSFFVPLTELTAGTRWSLSYGLTERYLGKDGSDISFSTPFTMQNRISMLRMEHMVAGEMIDKGQNSPLVFGFLGEDGRVRKSWLAHMDYEFIRQFKLRKNRMIFYGKTTLREDGSSTMYGTSGNAIEAGLGIRQQISPANQSYYDTLSFDRLRNTLLEISVGRKTMEDRHFVIGTGEYGLAYLHDMLATHLNSTDYNWMMDTTGRAYSWKGNDIHVNYGQFRGFASINGLKVSFMHLDHYDNPIENKLIHPNGGVAESYRMTIMDIGSKSDPNIHKVRIKNFNPHFRYIPGMRDPFYKGGALGGSPTLTASKVDGYEMMLMDKEGAVVIDPTRIVEFIPSILQ